MSIYEKPTKTLMREFVEKKLKPGQVFDKKYAVDWFTKHYPDIKSNTVQIHVEGMSVNSKARKHHRNVKSGSGHDLFFRLGPNQYRLWDKTVDPAPVYRDQLLNASDETQETADAADEEDREPQEGMREFAFESDLQNYLVKNLHSLEPGLILYQEEGFSGVEFPAGGRRIDILAVDAQGGFVVIELKVSKGYDRVIGQLLRYMAWVQKNLSEGKPVRGIIVANNITDDLKLAASSMPNVRLVEYTISFKLNPVSS